MNSITKIARTAGLLYLLYVITSVVANLFGKFVFVEAPVTINHILTHATQFCIGFVINLFSVVLFLLAAWALFVLLKPVNKDFALLFLLFNVAGFAVWLFSSLCLFASLVLLNGPEAIKAFQPDQLQALAVFFFGLYKTGVVIAQVPYGVWLFPLGYLVLKSNFLPKILGMLLIADGISLFVYVCQRLIFPDLAFIAYPCLVISFIAEVSLALWLLILGVKDKKPTLADGQK
ncbi:DUF4386 domain-containing protein [bacterium]|nr:DUF4386 domain-containing protein [bacterium]